MYFFLKHKQSSTTLFVLQAKNRLGETTCSGKVTVGSKPKFTSKFYDQDVFTNEKVTFACKIRGEPAPRVSWLYDNQPLTVSPYKK